MQGACTLAARPTCVNYGVWNHTNVNSSLALRSRQIRAIDDMTKTKVKNASHPPEAGTNQGQEGGSATFSGFDLKIASEAAAILKDWAKGQRTKAKKALQKLAKDYPNSYLPHRYTARVLYHEAAVLESSESGGSKPSEQRLQLLKDALEAAHAATELNSHSLSSAALRATCVVNVLVEESSLFGNKSQQGARLSDSRCHRIKGEFKDALAACSRALTSKNPTLIEPVISIADGTSQTCDPCCLRVQDQILTWCKEERWDRIAQEKRSVLSCMTQVLESCYTLLDSTQIPVDGIVRLLQHILRPQQQELQMWASQLLLGKGMTLEDLQKKFETQAAVAELLKMLRPNGSTEQALPGSAAALLRSHVLPPQLQQQLQQQQQQLLLLQQQQQQVLLQQQQQHLQQVQQGQSAALPHSPLGAQDPQQQQQQLFPSRALRPEPNQCLSLERDWDWEKDLGSASGVPVTVSNGNNSSHMNNGNNNNSGNNNGRRRSKKQQKGAVGDRGRHRSRYERYMDVEAFWRSTTPEQRRELLRVPMASLLQAVRQDHGPEAAEEVCEGLVLLREQGNSCARYWACPVCDQRFSTSKEYMAHVELVHEELAVVDDKYVGCVKCQSEVVGMYYTSTRTPGCNVCFRCHQAALRMASPPEDINCFEKVFPPSSAKSRRAWSDTSDFISTRDSFSSEDGSCPVSQQQRQHSQTDALAGGRDGGSGQLIGDEDGGEDGSRALLLQQQQLLLLQIQPTLQQQASEDSKSTYPGLPGMGGPSSAAAPASAAYPAGTEAARSWVPPERRPGADVQCDSMEAAGPALPQELFGIGAGSGQGGYRDGSVNAPRGAAPASVPELTLGSASASASRPVAPLPQPQAAVPVLAPLRPSSHDHGLGTAHPHPPSRQHHHHGHRRSSSRGSEDLCQEMGGKSKSMGKSGAGSGGKRDDGGIGGGLWKSWWPHRLMQSWSSDKEKKRGQMPSGIIPMSAVGDLNGGPSSGPGQMKVAALCAASDKDSVGDGSRLQQEGSLESAAGQRRRGLGSATAILDAGLTAPGAGNGDGGAVVGDDVDGLSIASGVSLADSGSIGDEQAGDFSGELREVIQLVEEVMRRMREIYGADREIGDMSLGSITQFVYRKLSTMLDEIAPQEEAPVVRHCLDEFLDQPSCVFQKPDVLRAVLGCLPFRDLQMVLAYVVRQHGDAMSRAEEGGSEGTTCGLDEDDEGALDDELEDEEDELAGASLFQVVVEDESAFDQLIAEAWNCEDELLAEEMASRPAVDAQHAAATSASAAGEQQQQQPQQHTRKGGVAAHRSGGDGAGGSTSCQAGELNEMLLMAGLEASDGGSGAMLATPSAVTSSEPFLVVTDWWLEHLALKAHQEAGEGGSTREGTTARAASPAAADAGHLATLRWVYGKIASQLAEEFAAKQRELRAGRDRDTTVLELYEDVAYAWRSLQATTDKRNRLEELRRNARAQFALAKQLEEERNQCTMQQATEFLSAINGSQQGAVQQQQQPGQQPAYLYLCEQAVDVVRRYPALAQEPSQRYARSLLDRELAVLLLSEAMLLAESEEAARDKLSAEDQLKKNKQEAKEVEGEYARVESEGPASHRKKDLLDKATKEAEHRERLQDLLTRLTALNERIAAEEGSRHKAADRLAETERDLEAVRAQLRQHATRKKHLEDVCAQLDCPVPCGPEAQGSTADMEWRAQRLECLMYRVLWVSEAVQTFREQYSPHSGGLQYELFIKATNWAKNLADDYDEQIKSWLAELEKLRRKLREAACVDLGYELAGFAQDMVCRRIEAAARHAREHASLRLLRELEEEEEVRRRADFGAGAGGGVSTGSGNGAAAAAAAAAKSAKKKNKQKATDKQRDKKEKEELGRLAKLAEGEIRKRAEDEEKLRLAIARQARETAIEAELERRRCEIEALEAQREAEAIRAAQEASLCEQAAAAARSAQASSQQAALPCTEAAAASRRPAEAAVEVTAALTSMRLQVESSDSHPQPPPPPPPPPPQHHQQPAGKSSKAAGPGAAAQGKGAKAAAAAAAFKALHDAQLTASLPASPGKLQAQQQQELSPLDRQKRNAKRTTDSSQATTAAVGSTATEASSSASGSKQPAGNSKQQRAKAAAAAAAAAAAVTAASSLAGLQDASGLNLLKSSLSASTSPRGLSRISSSHFPPLGSQALPTPPPPGPSPDRGPSNSAAGGGRGRQAAAAAAATAAAAAAAQQRLVQPVASQPQSAGAAPWALPSAGQSRTGHGPEAASAKQQHQTGSQVSSQTPHRKNHDDVSGRPVSAPPPDSLLPRQQQHQVASAAGTPRYGPTTGSLAHPLSSSGYPPMFGASGDGSQQYSSLQYGLGGGQPWSPTHAGAAAAVPAFNPFAENPLLKAFSSGGTPGAPSSQASSVGTASAGSPGMHGGVAPVSAPRPNVSGYTTPLLSPRVEQALSPTSTQAPDPDHIMSIMSILEPETGNGQMQHQGGAGTASPASLAAQQRAMLAGLGFLPRDGGGSSGLASGQSGQQLQQQHGGGVANPSMGQAHGDSGTAGTASSGISSVGLAGLSGFNIWSSGGTGAAAGSKAFGDVAAATAAAWGSDWQAKDVLPINLELDMPPRPQQHQQKRQGPQATTSSDSTLRAGAPAFFVPQRAQQQQAMPPAVTAAGGMMRSAGGPSGNSSGSGSGGYGGSGAAASAAAAWAGGAAGTGYGGGAGYMTGHGRPDLLMAMHAGGGGMPAGGAAAAGKYTMGLFSGDAVNWGHAGGNGGGSHPANSAWAPYGGGATQQQQAGSAGQHLPSAPWQQLQQQQQQQQERNRQ